jgi:hypothetical protein
LDGPVTPSRGLAESIWIAVEAELDDSAARAQRTEPVGRPGWRGPLAAAAVAAVVLGIGVATWVLLAPRGQTPVATTTTTTMPVTTSLPRAPSDAVVGTPEDGYSEVLAALDQAADTWQPDEDYRYAYRINVSCDCPDDGTRWVRHFGQGAEEDPWDVAAILSRIRTDIEGSPARVEAAFSSEDGHPTFYSVRWPEGSAGADLVLGVDDFHEISLEPSAFAGDWRFTSGVVNGREFGNPATYGAIYLTLDAGFASFPVDCNTGGGIIDIYEDMFGIGEIATTAAGCSDFTEEAELFVTGIEQVERISSDGDGLLMTGPGVELHFVVPGEPESLGALPLAAAGESVLLEFPDGRARGVTYTIGDPHSEPGRSIWYVLTAESDGVDSEAGWEEWAGEFEVPDLEVSGTGPDRVVIPDSIQVGDYRLCSPYWEPDPFCFDLPIRPASAAWFVTAGTDGVVLHDANGTSTPVSDEGTAIAFSIGGRVIAQPIGGGLVAMDGNGGAATEIPIQPGEILLDVAWADGRPVAVVTDRSDTTTMLDLDSGERVDVGPSSIEARIHDSTVLLRLSDTGVEARSLTGDLLWLATVDAETMVVPADPGVVRFDRFGELNTDSDPPFRQYLQTRLIDMGTGEEIDAFEYELAIPLEGDQITDRCVRAELSDGLMLCPQPDGRLVTLQVEGGDMIDFPAGGGGIGTFVRVDG